MNRVWWLIPLLFYYEENTYFGWNAVPHSGTELIADGIVLLLAVLVQIGMLSNDKERTK